jgi:hypothetical protein
LGAKEKCTPVAESALEWLVEGRGFPTYAKQCREEDSVLAQGFKSRPGANSGVAVQSEKQTQVFRLRFASLKMTVDFNGLSSEIRGALFRGASRKMAFNLNNWRSRV